jgi:hypothetical protein
MEDAIPIHLESAHQVRIVSHIHSVLSKCHFHSPSQFLRGQDDVVGTGGWKYMGGGEKRGGKALSHCDAMGGTENELYEGVKAPVTFPYNQ